jgi:F0F1-type ATP synthase assembly protein I
MFWTLFIAVVGVGVTVFLANVVEATPMFVGIAVVVVLGMGFFYVVLMRDEYRRSRSEGAPRIRSLFRSLRRAIGFMISST